MTKRFTEILSIDTHGAVDMVEVDGEKMPVVTDPAAFKKEVERAKKIVGALRLSGTGDVGSAIRKKPSSNDDETEYAIGVVKQDDLFTECDETAEVSANERHIKNTLALVRGEPLEQIDRISREAAEQSSSRLTNVLSGDRPGEFQARISGSREPIQIPLKVERPPVKSSELCVLRGECTGVPDRGKDEYKFKCSTGEKVALTTTVAPMTLEFSRLKACEVEIRGYPFLEADGSYKKIEVIEVTLCEHLMKSLEEFEEVIRDIPGGPL